MLGETARLVGGGVAAGLLLAWLSANTIRAFLFQVRPLDPVTLGAVSGLIVLLALAVSLRAALRAAGGFGEGAESALTAAIHKYGGVSSSGHQL